MEATLFTGWIYDLLKPLAEELKVAHPPTLKAIAAAKKKNDKVDARMLADLLRWNLLPQCCMTPVARRRCVDLHQLPFREFESGTMRPTHDFCQEPGLLESANPFGKLKLHAF